MNLKTTLASYCEATDCFAAATQRQWHCGAQ
jgi:hypothetical protein